MTPDSVAFNPVGAPPSRQRVRRLLCPASVAIVGASPTAGSLGASVLGNLERAGYGGAIHLVNPKRREILGRPCLASADALPLGVDCAVLAIPRAGVLAALEACARRKVGSAVIFSAGFAESDAAGRAEQEAITTIARDHDMVVLGPNCLGMMNYVENVALTFVSTPAARLAERQEGIAIVSQSGAMAAVLVVALASRQLGISYSVSTGNEAASGVEDYVEFLIEDPQTRVLTMIVEQFRAPRRFLALVERAQALGKRIVLLHPGRSGAARASAQTHTGALTGDYEVMRTLVTAAGVVMVDTLEELMDVSELLLRWTSLPQGGAAVVAESGAFKALTLDFCERNGLGLPAFTSATNAALRAVLPDFIAPTNPMDLTAHALVDPGLYRKTLPLMIADAHCGSLVLTIILTDASTCDLKLPPILDAIKLVQTQTPKPILFAGLDEGARIPPHYVEALRGLGVPFFASPERALQALAAVTGRAAPPSNPGAAASGVLLGGVLHPGVMPEYQSKAVLQAAGIAVPAGALAHSAEEARAAAGRIGYPVALKAQSAELSHKSDAGGVLLNLHDADAVTDGWRRIHAATARALPGLVLEGVLVEAMGRPGVELIAGARRDPDWGLVLLVGFGGVLAEALQDVRLLSPNLGLEAMVEAMLQLKCAPLLRGFRGSPALDVRAAAEILMKLGALLRAQASIIEVDINPVVVYPAGQGAMALDALMVTR